MLPGDIVYLRPAGHQYPPEFIGPPLIEGRNYKITGMRVVMGRLFLALAGVPSVKFRSFFVTPVYNAAWFSLVVPALVSPEIVEETNDWAIVRRKKK